jgi:hypothetical protein
VLLYITQGSQCMTQRNSKYINLIAQVFKRMSFNLRASIDASSG